MNDLYFLAIERFCKNGWFLLCDLTCSDAARQILQSPFFPAEIKMAMFKLNPNKVHGLNSRFFLLHGMYWVMRSLKVF